MLMMTTVAASANSTKGKVRYSLLQICRLGMDVWQLFDTADLLSPPPYHLLPLHTIVITTQTQGDAPL